MHIAIVGCGQLSRMLALAGKPLGLRFSFVADLQEDTRCVDGLGAVVRWGAGQDVAALYVALGEPDRITVEKEQVELALLQQLQQHCPVYPGTDAFAASQHRYREKQLLDSLEIPCSAYTYNETATASVAKLSLPVVVKSCRHGYDGKNQWVLKTEQDVSRFDAEVQDDDHIVEAWVPYEKEVSQVSVRGEDGVIRHYPLTENLHEKGILRSSLAPARDVSAEMKTAAQEYLTRIMESLGYVGVMAMECFVLEDKLLVNELAPRVHNSGHWTQTGAVTCQFSNHIRAVAGLPLGSTENHGVAGMFNLIGTHAAPTSALSAKTSLHWYDKSVRPGRKLGHINVLGDDYSAVLDEMQRLEGLGLVELRA